MTKHYYEMKTNKLHLSKTCQTLSSLLIININEMRTDEKPLLDAQPNMKIKRNNLITLILRYLLNTHSSISCGLELYNELNINYIDSF